MRPGSKLLIGVGVLGVVYLALLLWPSQPSKSLTPRAIPMVKKSPPQPPLTPTIKIDSRMTREEALSGNKFPHSILNKMEVVSVRYLGFDGLVHEGQIVVAQDLASEVQQIFQEILKIKFPIGRVVPVVRYGWDDHRSMAANNSSGFNYRGQVTPNGKSQILSKHAYGRAIDMNPAQNPYISISGKSTEKYDPSKPGTLTSDSAVVKIFLRRGWKWGGNWSNNKDYQHFEKP